MRLSVLCLAALALSSLPVMPASTDASSARAEVEPASGSVRASQVQLLPQSTPATALPAAPTAAQIEQARQARSRVPAPPLPLGPGVDPGAIGPSTPPASVPGAATAAAEPLGATDFVYFTNVDLGAGAPSTNTSVVNEPTVGNSGQVVFISGNWYAALSTDGGESFDFVNPFAGPFTPANDGFCCDQVVVPSPEQGALFYMQQYVFDGTSGTQRINVDQQSDGVFDCFYDVIPQLFGLPDGRWFDFPDLTVGEDFLYHSTNVVNEDDPFVSEAMMLRYPLADLAACGPIGADFLVSDDRFSFRATQGAGTDMFWAAHNTTSSIRIYRWPEGSPVITFDDRTIDAWNVGAATCPGPDGKDWCGRADDRILGAWQADGVLGFMWNAPQGGGFPYPHVQIARFTQSDRTLIDQSQIWSDSFAWLYPSVGVNAQDELAGTILWGGGPFFPNCATWIADSVNGGSLFPLETYQAVNSTSGPDENKSGDYLATRPHWPFPSTWVGTCFSLQGGGANANARPRYLWFGRQSAGPVFADLGVATEGSGTVTGEGIACPGDCSESYFEGSTVEITAVPADGWSFAGWEGDCAGQSGSTCVLVMTTDRSATATFTDCPATVAVTGTPGAGSILDTIYRVRDEVLAVEPEAREYSELYYRHAPEAGLLLLRDPRLRARALALIERLMPALEDLLAGRPAKISASDIAAIEWLIDAVAAEASPDMRRDLARIRRDLHDRDKLSRMGVVSPPVR